MVRDSDTQARANAEVLLWQGRVRVVVAIIAGGASVVLQQAEVLQGSPERLAAVVITYVALIGLLGWQIRRENAAGDLIVATTVLADLMFIFSSTIAASAVTHYDRILILSFFVLHLTESHFGRKHALFALLAVIGGYAAVIAKVAADGAPLRVAEELWSVGLFAIAGIAFIKQYGSFQGRLEHIVDLFESAEEGDFSDAYDVAGDHRPDAITRVGRAYNRVRLQLTSMVLTDPLTGCLNRRGLDQALAREIARASRAGSELALLAIDLDHFKHVNDHYGHSGGDHVLREFGTLLVQAARAGDVVARTGGEEFTILLPDIEPAGAYRAGVRLCDAVRLHPFIINARRVHITISVGVMSTTSQALDSIGSTLKQRADEALYAAKRGGRDRVRVWNEALASLATEPSGLPGVPESSRAEALLPPAGQVVSSTSAVLS